MATGRLAQKMLDEMKRTAEGGGARESRKSIVRQSGQLLVIDQMVFIRVLGSVFPSMPTTVQQKVWTDWDAWLKTQSKNVKSNRRFNELVEAKKGLVLKPTERCYIISSYETIRTAKAGTKTANKTAKLREIIERHFDKGSETEFQRLGGMGDTHGAQLGHSQDGRGLAASGATILQTQRVLQQAGGDARIQEVVNRAKNTLGISIQHDQLLTKTGRLRKKYIPILTWQSTIDNQTQKEIEKAAIETLRRELKEIATMPGSTPLDDAIGEVMLDSIAGKKQKNKKTTGKRRKQVKETSKSKRSKPVKSKKKVKVLRDSGIGKHIAGPATGGQQSYVALMTLLDSKINRQVLQNMKYPALQNRTGTFASSVRITDIVKTPQGFPSIGYTYQENPYRVFEVGASGAWASSERDPRRLIDKSIREIAADFAIGRFYTRRV